MALQLLAGAILSVVSITINALVTCDQHCPYCGAATHGCGRNCLSWASKLFLNAVDHAFPNGRIGAIHIKARGLGEDEVEIIFLTTAAA